MTNIEKLDKVRAYLSHAYPTESAAHEALQAIGEVCPSKLDDFLSKDSELPVLWAEFLGILGKAAPIIMRPKVLTWIVKQAAK